VGDKDGIFTSKPGVDPPKGILGGSSFDEVSDSNAEAPTNIYD